jgi:hypothetical protein
MGTLLLQNPLVQFYLLCIGAWWVVVLWGFLLNPPHSGQRPDPVKRGGPGQGFASSSPLPARTLSVSRPGRQTDKEGEPTAGLTTWGALRASVAAPTSGKRREYHVVTP